MLWETVRESLNVSLLGTVYPALRTEYRWWMSQGAYGHALKIADASGRVHVLNR